MSNAGPADTFGADAWTQVYHITVTMNQSAADGSGVHIDPSDSFTSTDGIIAANGNDDCSGSITSHHYVPFFAFLTRD